MTTAAHALAASQLTWSRLAGSRRRRPRERRQLATDEECQHQPGEPIELRTQSWPTQLGGARLQVVDSTSKTAPGGSMSRLCQQASGSTIVGRKPSLAKIVGLSVWLGLVVLCLLASCQANLKSASGNTNPASPANGTASTSTANSSDTNFQNDETQIVSNANSARASSQRSLLKQAPLRRLGNQHREHVNYKTTYACEGNQMELSCQDGKWIHLVRANYGRFSLSICNDLGHSNYSVQCASFRAFLFMETRCNKLNNCNVTVSKELFGDPCEGTSKYLEVQYFCTDARDANNNAHKPPVSQQPQINGQPTNVRNNQQPTGAAGGQQQLSSQGHKSQAGAANQQQVLVGGGNGPDADAASQALGGDSALGGGSPAPQPPTTGAPLDPSADFNQQQQQQPPPVIQAQPFCSPQLGSRNLFWNATRAGQFARQPCPEGAAGSAQWLCDAARLRFVPAHSADFGQCRSVWLTRLAQQLDQKLEAPPRQQSVELRRQNDEQMLREVLAELALMARTKELFGEDLRRLDIMVGQMIAELKSLAVLYNGPSPDWRPRAAPAGDLGSLHEQLFVRLADTLSSLFEWAQKNAWLELAPAERRKLESRFLGHLREAGLMLANALPADQLGEAFQPVRFANVVAGLVPLLGGGGSNGQQQQRRGLAVAADGTTGEFNLFAGGNSLANYSPNNRFGALDEEPAVPRGAEFRIAASLADELAANGVAKFLIIDIKKPDYPLVLRLQLEQQQQQQQQQLLSSLAGNPVASSQFAGDAPATLFDSSSSAPAAGDQRVSARVFGLFAIVQDSGLSVLDSSQPQDQQQAPARQLELDARLQGSLAQWPVSVEFRTPAELAGVARQCQSAANSNNNRCQMSRANATHSVCICDRFGFVALTGAPRGAPLVPSTAPSFLSTGGALQNDQWSAPTTSGADFEQQPADLQQQQQPRRNQPPEGADYVPHYIQSGGKTGAGSLGLLASIFVCVGLGLLVLSLGACGVGLVSRFSAASKFAKKPQGFLDTLGARRGPASGPLVLDHNLLGSDPLVSGAAGQSAAGGPIVGLATSQQQQHQHHQHHQASNSLVTSCTDAGSTYKTRQQLYAANVDSAPFANVYAHAHRPTLRATLAGLLARPAHWLGSLAGLKRGGYDEHAYDAANKANRMLHQQQGGLAGGSLGHSAANTLASSAYKCQNGYTTSLGLYNPSHQQLIAQNRTLSGGNQQQQQLQPNQQLPPAHSVPLNSSSNSSYVSSSAYYEEIGPGNLAKLTPGSRGPNGAQHNQGHFHLQQQQLAAAEQFKRSAGDQQPQQHQFNSWAQRTLNGSSLVSANLMGGGQPMQTMGANKHLIQHTDLSPLQSSSTSSSAGSQHSTSTNLTTANSSTPRHYLFASPSAVSAYKQQFRNQGS